MSKKFNLKNYNGDVAMHCPTKESAEVFCDFLDKNGRKWECGKSYPEETKWEETNDICYLFNEGEFSDLDFCNEKEYGKNRYTVLEFYNFKWGKIND